MIRDINELTIVYGIIDKFDRLIGHKDLSEYHFNNKLAWKIYNKFCNTDQWDLNKDNVLEIILNMRKDDLITSQEYLFVIEHFGEYEYLLSDSKFERSYIELKERKLKDHIVYKLNNIDMKNIKYKDLKSELESLLIDFDDEVKVETAKQISELKEDKSYTGLRIGFPRIDNVISIESNHLIMLIARPFCGKTTTALRIAMENTKNKRVLFYSMEMSKFQLVRKIKSYGGYYHKENLYIVEKSKSSVEEIVRTAKKINADFIIIDQLNKITPNKGTKEYEQFSNIAKELKIKTTESKIPILCLAQVHRESNSKDRPRISNAKGSGSIEEECDIGLVLHKEEQYGQEKSISTLYLDKNRSSSGFIGYTELTYDHETGIVNEA